MNITVKGKVAVITGAGGVICSTLAKDMAAQGAKVALLDLSLEKAQAAADGIIQSGGEAIAVGVNVLDVANLEQAAEKVIQKFGRVDILINGAGGNHPKSTTGPEQSYFDMPKEAIAWVFDLNFLGTVLPTQVFGKRMAQQKSGSIVNIASMASFRPLTRTLAYSASKAAIVNYTQWMSVHFCQEYSPNIRVNAIAPGFLLTQQNEYLLIDKEKGYTPRGQSVIDNTPMGRFGEPSEISGAVIFLCSDEARFITGVTLPIDGGFNSFAGV
jgi:NAD(P)-dependent dehydrogenase (short-subunit alcohol dehydrogenase family)